MRSPETQVMHLRLPLDLYEKVEAFAKSDRRSKNNAAVYLLEKGLEAHEDGEQEASTR